MQDQTVPTTTTTTPNTPVLTPIPETTNTESKPAFMNMSVETTPSTIPPEAPPVQTTPPPTTPGKGPDLKKIAAVLGIVLLIGATGSGMLLLRNSQVNQTQAWDCNKYNFSVSRDGVVTVINGSTDNVPPNKATVDIDNNQVGSFDVPALAPGQSSTLGQVTVPTSATFSWAVNGTASCTDAGIFQATVQAAAQCTGVTAFTVDWAALTSSDLEALKPGDKVRFVTSVATTGGTVDMVRFIINEETMPETSTLKPGTNDFYYEYTIPQNTVDFKVTAQVHDQISDTWY